MWAEMQRDAPEVAAFVREMAARFGIADLCWRGEWANSGARK